MAMNVFLCNYLPASPQCPFSETGISNSDPIYSIECQVHIDKGEGPVNLRRHRVPFDKDR